MAGTAEYGDMTIDSSEWTVKWNTFNYSEILIAFGNMDIWIMINKDLPATNMNGSNITYL